MDIAPLTFRVDSSGAVTAEGDLDQLTAAAGRADNAQDSLAASAGRAAAAETNMSAKAKAATAAVNAHTAAAKANTAAMNMQAAASRAVAGRQQQMMYQTNDIAMSLASGQAPYMVAIQQGSQLAQVYAGPGGLNNALSDFRKLMGGVIGTLVRFAGPMALAAAGAATAYYAYRQLTKDARDLEEAFTDLEGIMEKNIDAMADTNEYALRIDLARIGREADESISPIDGMAKSLTGVAAALNDITVARFIEQTSALGAQIDETEAKIAKIQSIANPRLDPSALYSAGGNITAPGLNERQQVELRNAEIQLAALQRRFENMGRGVLTEGQAEGVFGALLNGDLKGAAEQFRDALKGTLEEPKKVRTGIDEAARAMGRLTSQAEKYEVGRAEASMDEIERIQYRRDRDIEAIWEAAEEAKSAGNDVHTVNMLATQAERDAMEKAALDVAELRRKLAEQNRNELAREWEALKREWESDLRDAERRANEIERLNANRIDLDRSLQPGTPEQQVDWWEQDQLARNQELMNEEIRLFGETEAIKFQIRQDYLARETEIERQAAEQRQRIRADQYSATLAVSSDFFGAMGAMLDGNTEKQSAAAETAFAIAQGLNLAQAIMNSYVAVTEAWADPTVPFFMKIAASIQAATTVMQAVAQIRSTTLSGAREMGGPVYSGGTYLVGEKGPELFTPGATGQITSNANLQKAMSGRQDGGQQASGVIRLILSPDLRAQVDDTARKLVVVESEARSAPARALSGLQDDIANGGDTSRLLEGQYALNRGAGSR